MIIICHCRKKAEEISEHLRTFSRCFYADYRCVLEVLTCCCGYSLKKIKKQVKDKFPHVVVGTVGKIMMLLQDKSLNFLDVTRFVVTHFELLIASKGMYAQICPTK